MGDSLGGMSWRCLRSLWTLLRGRRRQMARPGLTGTGPWCPTGRGIETGRRRTPWKCTKVVVCGLFIIANQTQISLK